MHYQLSKIRGTRFVSCREKGYNRFLHQLSALVTIFENYQVHTKSGIQGQVSKLLKALRSTKIHNMCAPLPSVFGQLTPSSLVFEGHGLMAYAIFRSIQMTIKTLQEMVNNYKEVETDSIIRVFQFHIGIDGKIVAIHEYCKASHEKRKLLNREHFSV